jgi:Cof subfamily protein (haloacid dehalogenase superfamily)
MNGQPNSSRFPAMLEWHPMPIRLVGIDLDGTLLNSRSELSPANQQAIAAAAGRGVQVAVVTGRRSHSARKYIEQIPCPVTLISSNGALVTLATNEVIHRDFLPCAVARRVLEASREYRPYVALLFDIPGRGQIVMQHTAVPEGPLGWFLAQSADCLELTDDLESALASDPIQVLFGGPPILVEPIEGVLRASSAASEVHLTWTRYLRRNVSLLDVMNRGCSKGNALAILAGHCGIDSSEVMAIGDNHNDLEMLRFAARPVLMANSSPGLEGEGFTTTLSNDQDGVAHAIESHVLC